MSQKTVVTNPESYLVQPNHIDARRHLFEAFDHTETEISAGWIIRFMQERGRSWAPFTYDEINTFYSRHHGDGFTFNRLVEPAMIPPSLVRAFAGYHDSTIPAGGGWIIKDSENKYHVTDDFVNRCFKSSPAKGALSTST